MIPHSFLLASGAVLNLSGWEICWKNGGSRYLGGRQKRTMTGTVTKAWDVTWEGGVGVGLGTFSDPGVGTRVMAQGLKKATLGTT